MIILKQNCNIDASSKMLELKYIWLERFLSITFEKKRKLDYKNKINIFSNSNISV